MSSCYSQYNTQYTGFKYPRREATVIYPTRVVARFFFFFFMGEKQNPEKGQKKEERDVRTKSNGGRGRVRELIYVLLPW